MQVIDELVDVHVSTQKQVPAPESYGPVVRRTEKKPCEHAPTSCSSPSQTDNIQVVSMQIQIIDIVDTVVEILIVAQRQIPMMQAMQKTIDRRRILLLCLTAHRHVSMLRAGGHPAVVQRRVPAVVQRQVRTHVFTGQRTHQKRCKRSSSTKRLTLQPCHRDRQGYVENRETHRHSSWTRLSTRPFVVYPTSLTSLFSSAPSVLTRRELGSHAGLY